MRGQKRGRIRPRTDSPKISPVHVPTAEAKKIYDDFVSDLRKRQLSSSENFDKSILTYSSAGLAISLTFLKDFIPIRLAIGSWLLYSSWGLFAFATIITIISFLVSYQAQEKMQAIAERYYIDGDQDAFAENGKYNPIINGLNYASGIAFILALVFTTLFVSTNLSKAESMNTKTQLVNDGLGTPLMQKVGEVPLQKGLPTGSMPKVPPTVPQNAPPVSPGSQTTNNQSSK